MLLAAADMHEIYEACVMIIFMNINYPLCESIWSRAGNRSKNKINE